MKIDQATRAKIGSACLFVNGIILIFYALLVPAFERGVHWLITLAADLLFTLSFLARLSHDLAYALGNAIFVIGVLVLGVITLKMARYKWVAYLSIITGIIGLASYLPLPSNLLSTISLLLLGLWSLGVGFSIRKLRK